MSLKLMH